MPIRVLALLATIVVAVPSARAEWTKVGDAPGQYLVDVSAPDANDVFTAGSVLTGSGLSTSWRTQVRASHDGGATFDDISGSLAEGTSLTDVATAIDFVTPTIGFVAIGHHVARTTDGGTTWTSTTLAFSVNALSFLDQKHGLAVGDGGRIARTSDGGASWTESTSPVTTPLRHVKFLDANHAFASGHDVDADTGHPSGGVLVSSTDGGVTWTKGAELGADGISSLFFLCDARTGFVAATRWDASSGYLASLYETTDGGRTLTDLNLPRSVGHVSAFGTSQTLQTGEILTQFWDDRMHGRLGALAYLGSRTTGQSGGGSSSSSTEETWKVVDYATSDGATWTHDDLGSITISLTSDPSDGAFTAGTMRDSAHGFLVGDDGVVFATRHACAQDAECPDGDACTGGDCTDSKSVSCATKSGSSADGGSDPLGRVGDGCGCDASGTVGALALLALFGLRRRRA